MGRPKKTTEDWIKEAKACHDDRYDYSETVYNGSNKKLTIICKKHGPFVTFAGDFLKGNNCPQCAIEARRVDMDEYAERAKKAHNGKYINYRMGKTPRRIIATCPLHGDFEQDKFAHLNGQGCPHCGTIRRTNKAKTQEELNEYFIKRAKKVHGDTYDYSKAVYVNNTTPVEIVCKKHGAFKMKPVTHISAGAGCPQCANERQSERFTWTQEQFEKKAREVHGDKYTYGRYNGMRKNMEIICPIHGKFLQAGEAHSLGKGCPKCGREQAAQTMTHTFEEFLERAEAAHHGKYDYSITEYNGVKSPISYICHEVDKYGNEHGVVTQNCASHLSGVGCPKCNRSHLETDLAFFLKTNNVKFRAQKKFPWLGLKSLDFYLPEYNVAVECQGQHHYEPVKHFGGVENYEYTHSNDMEKMAQCLEHGIPLYHFTYMVGKADNIRTFNDPEKLLGSIRMCECLCNDVGGEMVDAETFKLGGVTVKLARSVTDGQNVLYDLCGEYEENGERLVIVFDHEISLRRNIVIEKLKRISGTYGGLKAAYGRKCTIKDIPSSGADTFHEKFHIQGKANGTVHLAADLDGKTVGVMSFKRLMKDSDEWELVRFSTDSNYRCPGVAGKLFKHFVETFKPSSVKSFADRRWTSGKTNMYLSLGFRLDEILRPDYSYVGWDGIPRHKFGFRKEKMSKRFGFPMTMTERQMTERAGFSRVWNAGLIKYVWASNG